MPHFRAWASDLILDTDESWHPEDFQEAFLEDLFAGIPECWLVVPEGNGKTTLLAGVALYHCEHRPFAVVPVAAASREQAEIMYRQAEGFVLRSPRLHELVFSDIQAAKGKRKLDVPRFVCLEGYRRINHHGGGRIQIFAADDRTGDGVIPTLGVIDELHRQQDLSLYRTWSGKLAKRQGQIVTISTAGAPFSDFEMTREKILAEAEELHQEGSFMRARSKRIVMHQYALPAGEDPQDLEAVKRANPFTGVTVEMLAEKLGSPTMTMFHWLRFVCNRATQDFDTWLGPDAESIWRALADPWELEPGAPTWVGVDVALKRDTTAVVAVQRRPDPEPDGRWHVRCRIWEPGEGRPVDVTDVMEYIRELDRVYDLRAVSYDPRFFDVPAKMLEDEGLIMVEVPQSIEHMTPAVGDTYAVIMKGELSHDGQADFDSHVLSAAPRHNDRGFTLAKGKSRGHIDGAVGMVLGIDRALRQEPEPDAVAPWFSRGAA